MLKRLSILALAILLAAGLTVQLVPHAASAMAMKASPSVPCEMGSEASPPCQMAEDGGAIDPAPEVPCKGMMPDCVVSLGCVAIVDLPAPAATASPVDWITVAWTVGNSYLAGLEVEPELFPPIRSA